METVSEFQPNSNVDINTIDDEDLLRKLWQSTEDFAEKRRIRARMYKLREKRLKEFYTSDDVVGEFRAESPYLMEAQPAPDTSVSMSTGANYYFTSSSTSYGTQSVTAMEVDDGNSRANEEQSIDVTDSGKVRKNGEQKRRIKDEREAVSEKIRKKSTERTKRYQKILTEIENQDSRPMSGDELVIQISQTTDGDALELAEPTRAEDLGISSTETMESSQTTIAKVDGEHSTSNVVKKTSSKTEKSGTGVRKSTTETSVKTERLSSGRKKSSDDLAISSQRKKSDTQGRKSSLTSSTVVAAVTERNGGVSKDNDSNKSLQDDDQQKSGGTVAIQVATAASSEEIKRTSSRRETYDGEFIIVIEVTETWRRILSRDKAAPVVQRVVVTKTTKKQLDGTIVEEDEDQVIDDLDSAGLELATSLEGSGLQTRISGKTTVVESPETNSVEEKVQAKKIFECSETGRPSQLKSEIKADKLAAFEESIMKDIEEYTKEAIKAAPEVKVSASANDIIESDSKGNIEHPTEAKHSGIEITELDMNLNLRASPCTADESVYLVVTPDTMQSPRMGIKSNQQVHIEELTVSEYTMEGNEQEDQEETGGIDNQPKEVRIKSKRTPSESPSRATKKRNEKPTVVKEIEISPGKKSTTTTATSTSTKSVGGVKQTTTSTVVSRVTELKSPSKDKPPERSSSIPKLTSSMKKKTDRADSNELRTSSTKKEKPCNGAVTGEQMDDSVAEFIKLEQELEMASQEETPEEPVGKGRQRPSELPLGSKNRSGADKPSPSSPDTTPTPLRSPLKEMASPTDRSPSPSSNKRQCLKSSTAPLFASSPTSSLPKRSTTAENISKTSSPKNIPRPQSPLTSSPDVKKTQENKAVKKQETKLTSRISKDKEVPTNKSSLRTPESSKLKSPVYSSLPIDVKPGLVRTVEITRTITIRDDDKPWRNNAKKPTDKTDAKSATTKPKAEEGPKKTKQDLHSNVMNVVEKYVDTEGCALHGSHKHVEKTVKRHDIKGKEEDRPSKLRQPMSTSTDRSPKDNKEPQRKLSPSSPQGTKSLKPVKVVVDSKPETDSSPTGRETYVAEHGIDDGLVRTVEESGEEPHEAELIEPEENLDGKYKEPLISHTSRQPVTLSPFERLEEDSPSDRTTQDVPPAIKEPELDSGEPSSSPIKEQPKISIKDSEVAKSKIAASPVLGSPSVVMKARSLFDTPDKPDKSDDQPERKTTLPSPVLENRLSISKIRSAFESPKSREIPKISEPVRKLSDERMFTTRRPSKEEKPASKLPKSPFEKTRSSPIRDSVRQVESPPKDTTEIKPQTPASETVEECLAASGKTVIEEIDDLSLLETMLSSATNYDDRSRIRAHIRTVKKKLGITVSTGGSASSSPMVQRRNITSATTVTTQYVMNETPKPSSILTAEPTERNALPEKVEPVEPTADEPVRKTSISHATITLKTNTEVSVEQRSTSTSSTSWRKSPEREAQPQIPWRASAERDSISPDRRGRATEAPWSRSPEKETKPSTPWSRPSEPADGNKPSEVVEPSNEAPWRKTSQTSESLSQPEEKPSPSSPRPFVSQKSQSQLKVPTHLPERDLVHPDMVHTLDITSSYGTGPMDENGKPLFGLGALRRKPKTPSPVESADETSPRLITERSQTLTELQKLHELQQIQSKEVPQSPSEKPRARLRDSFTTPVKSDVPEDTEPLTPKEPIISERSQALRDIIRKHEEVTTEKKITTTEIPSSPKPKAKLKDTFIVPDTTPSILTEEETIPREPLTERSEAFQTIIKRHQELSQVTQQPSANLAFKPPSPASPASPASPVKRPGILKKPKDWSSPSPQELASPVKEDSPKRQPEEPTVGRKSSIEVRLNTTIMPNLPVTTQEQDSLNADTTRRGSTTTQYTTQEVRITRVTSDNEERSSQPRRVSIETEPTQPSQTVTRTSVIWPIKSEENEVPTIRKSFQTQDSEYTTSVSRSSGRWPPKTRDTEPELGRRTSGTLPQTEDNKVGTAPFKLTGEPTGHSVRSTSTFQLQLTSNSTPSRESQPIPAQPVSDSDDPTPWRRKSIPREPSLPREGVSSKETTQIQIPHSVQPTETTSQTREIVQIRRTSETSEMRQVSHPKLETEVSTKVTTQSISNHVSPRKPSLENPTQATLASPAPTSDAPSWRKHSIEKPKIEPFRARGTPAGSSVRALAQKFQTPTSETPSKSGSYPRAGLIFRSSSFRQQDGSPDNRSSGNYVHRSESLRVSRSSISRSSVERQSQERDIRESSPSYLQSVSMEVNLGTPTPRKVSRDYVEVSSSPSTQSVTDRRTSVQSTTTWSTSNRQVRETSSERTIPSSATLEATPKRTMETISTSSSKSFLEDRSPVVGIQDIIQRMRAGDTNGSNSEDDQARSLLNKFLGAQILVQCTEPLVRSQTPDLVETVVTSSERTSPDGKSVIRSTTADRRGSRHQVTSGQDDQGRQWKQETTSSAISIKSVSTTLPLNENSANMADVCLVDGVDINTCTDDFKLNELLDNCNDYETRRKIRARIKAILNDSKGQGEMNKNARTFGTSVLTQSEVVTRQSNVRQSQPVSAFAKFQQLDKSVKTTPSWPHGSSSAKDGHFRLGEGLIRSASGVKDVLLRWCQARTRGYKNVQIDNFSTSWNDGLAFCALIHHFYPDAFDFDQLKPENRSYNFELAFKTAEEKAGIAPLLDVEDMVSMSRPDWKCVFTYVQSFYRRFKDEI